MPPAAAPLSHTLPQELCRKRHPGPRCSGTGAHGASPDAALWDSHDRDAICPTRHKSPATPPTTSEPAKAGKRLPGPEPPARLSEAEDPRGLEVVVLVGLVVLVGPAVPAVAVRALGVGVAAAGV